MRILPAGHSDVARASHTSHIAYETTRFVLLVLSINLIECGNEFLCQVGKPFIAIAGLGKNSKLSPKCRELLAKLADFTTALVDQLPIGSAVFRDPHGGSWRHSLHGGSLMQIISPSAWAQGIGHQAR